MSHPNRLAKAQLSCQNPDCRRFFREQRDIKTCTACHVAAYCDKGCQRAAWKLHKPDCLTWRAACNNAENTSILHTRFLRLKEFRMHHAISFLVIAHAAILSFQSSSVTSFNPRQHFLRLRLSYDPDQDSDDEGNPATRFRLVDAQIFPFAEFESDPNGAQAFEERFGCGYDHVKTIVNPNSPVFGDRPVMPLILHSVEAGVFAAPLGVNHDLFRPDSLTLRDNPDSWRSELQRRIERGYVYDLDEMVGCALGIVYERHLGKLVRVPTQERRSGERKWKYTPLSESETKANAYIPLT